ncbi:MAG: type VI secretion system membrane subunit TssM [Burkholderiales bacterium]
MTALRKVLALMFNRWVLFALGLVALALVIWFAGPLVAFADRRPLESETARWVLIGLVVLAFVARFVWQAWKARHSNARLMEGLAATPTPLRPEDAASAAELEILRKRFADAMAVLRTAHLGQSGRHTAGGVLGALTPRHYLYQLPWYVFIGPPGSGKTTALLNAGLRFPLAEKLGEQKLAGIGGTRNCDWWFTDEAVLIDTAGRYTTQASSREVDAAAWTGFLGLLKKYRPRRPLNGVLMTVSVADLLTQPPGQREVQAEAIRRRILELHEHLRVRLPIYVLVTKADLLAGFMEFFGEIGKAERAQVWGTTFPLEERPDTPPPLAAFDTEFGALAKRLNARVIDRMQDERDPRRRALVYGFPQQFSALGEPLRDLLERIFADSRFAQAGLLRGVYFTSGTQEGTPLDRVLGSLGRTLGLDRHLLPAQRPSGKSFFLTRLLSDVVFQEAGVAGTDRKAERRRALLHAAILGLATLVTIGAIVAWTVSYTKNREYVAEVHERAGPVAKLVASVNAVQSSDVVALLPMLQAVKDLAAASGMPGGATPAGMGYGLYQGDKLGSASDNAYRRMLQDAFLPRLQLRIESLLRGGARDNPDALYDALKAYVMLSKPERFDGAWFRSYVTADWEASLPRDITADSRKALEGHLDALLTQEPLASPLPIDLKLIASARESLARIPTAQRIYDGIRRDPATAALPEFTIMSKGGPSASLVFTRTGPLTKGVPGLYTRDVYRNAFEKNAGAAARRLAEEETWVLAGTQPDRGPLGARLLDEVRRLYLKEYGDRWAAFVADIRVRPVTGLQDSIQLASALSAPDSPLPVLFNAIVREVTLVQPVDDATKSVIERTVDKAKGVLSDAAKTAERAGVPGVPKPASNLEEALVDQRFERLRQFVRGVGGKPPAQIDQVTPLMTKLYQHLVAVKTAQESRLPPPPAAVVTEVKADAARMPDPVGPAITQLADQAMLGQRRSTIAILNEKLAPIAKYCAEAVTGRYPFAKSSDKDVPPEDFAKLFAPGGMIDRFVQQDLLPHVDTGARPWTYRRTGDLAGATTTTGLLQLQRAQAIRDVFFRGGGTAASLKLDVKPIQMDASITQFILDVDGQIVRYAHGPQVPTPIQWPGPRGSGQVRVQVSPPAAAGASGLTFEGPWALFRMLDRTQVDTTPQAERFNVTFNIEGRKATFEVTTSTVQNPFRLRDLEQFQCPSQI